MNGKRLKLIGALCALLVALLVGCSAVASNAAGSSSGSAQASSSAIASQQASRQASDATYKFRTNKQLKEHFEKHGKAMGYDDAQAYVAGANAVISNPDTLHKIQRDDGDDVYYLEATDEFVVVSPAGYIRTYFNPGGIAYYNRQ